MTSLNVAPARLVGRAWRYCRRDEVLSALEASGEVLSLGGGIVLEATRENLKSLAIKLKDEEAQGPVSLLSEKVTTPVRDASLARPGRRFWGGVKRLAGQPKT